MCKSELFGEMSAPGVSEQESGVGASGLAEVPTGSGEKRKIDGEVEDSDEEMFAAEVLMDGLWVDGSSGFWKMGPSGV